MAYRWWVFVHLAGVFGFLGSHGVSMGVSLRLRKERDPARVNALIEISARSIVPFYVAFGVLVAAGIVATTLGHLWGYGWIWAAIATLLVVSQAMVMMARPYHRKVAFVARAIADGSKAVTPEQFDEMLRSRRPVIVTWMGVSALAFILYLMLFKPTLGLAPGAPPPPAATRVTVTVEAAGGRFTSDRLAAPAGEPFTLAFRNADPGSLHNVAIYRDASARDPLFAGETFAGTASRSERVPALAAGSYLFRCDVHPTTMTGTIEAG